MEKFVEKFLFTAGVKQKYIDTLTSASSISYYTTACTDPSFDENNNYLFFRDLGTLSFYKAIIFYFVDKFPNVTEKTLTLNRNNTTRDSLVGVYMEKFGLGEHILYDPKIKLTEKNYQYIFEAIIGATEFLLDYNYKFGIGNIVIQKICFFYLDQVANLDESKLDNFKTILKEMYFDQNKRTNKLITEHVKDSENIFHVQLFDTNLTTGSRQKIGEGSSNTIITAEQIASEQAVQLLTSKGLIKEKKQKQKVLKPEQSFLYRAPRDQRFQSFILNLLKRVYFLTDLKLEKEDMNIFEKCFTHPLVHDNNYELLETIGDNILNKCVRWYISKRFPDLNCPEGISVSTKLKISLIDTKGYAKFAEELGFYDYISCFRVGTDFERLQLLEDVFESFFAATEIVIDKKYKKGMGYVACFKLLSNILDSEELDLNYNVLVDAKTQLKELFDLYKMYKIKYEYEPFAPFKTYIKEQTLITEGCGCKDYHEPTTHVYKKEVWSKFVNVGNPPLFGVGSTEKEAEQNVAKLALTYYNSKGISRPIPKQFLKFCV